MHTVIFFLISFSYIHSWSYEYLFSLQKYIIKIKRCLRLFQCSSLLVFFLFSSFSSVVLKMTMFYKYTWLSQQYGSYTSSREEEAVGAAAVAASQTALSQQEPPMEFYGIPHRWGKMGLNTFCFKLLEKTKRHVWSPTAEVSVQHDRLTCLQCFLQLTCSTCMSSQSTGTKGQRTGGGGGEEGKEEEEEEERDVLCCAQFHFINAFYLMALLFSGKA